MTDNFLPTPITTIDDGDAVVGLVGETETNRAEVDASGNLYVVAKQQAGEVDEVNIDKVGGTAVSVNSGVVDAGTIRVAPATDVVQRVSKNATANSSANPMDVELVSDGAVVSASNPLPVTVDASPGTSKDSGSMTAAAVAANGGTGTMDTVAITNAKTGYVIQMSVSSSARGKWELGTWNGSVFTVKRVFFTDAGESIVFDPKDYTVCCPFAGDGSTTKFRIRCTNLDNAHAVDFYSSIQWVEI